MGAVISLNSGESMAIIDFDDVLDIIREKLGYNITKEICDYIKEYEEEIAEIKEDNKELKKECDEVYEDAERMYKVLKEEGDSIENVFYYYLNKDENSKAYTKLKEARKNINEAIVDCHYHYV